MSERTKVAVVIRGGVVTEVYTNTDRVDVLIADYDIEGVERAQCGCDDTGDALIITRRAVDVSHHRMSVLERAASMSALGVPAKQCKVYLIGTVLEMGIEAKKESIALNEVLAAIDTMSDENGLIHLPSLLYKLEYDTCVTWDLGEVMDHLVRYLAPKALGSKPDFGRVFV